MSASQKLVLAAFPEEFGPVSQESRLQVIQLELLEGKGSFLVALCNLQEGQRLYG